MEKGGKIFMELRNMTNKEIATRVYDYLTKIDELKEEISKKLNNHEKINEDYVRSEYKSLKQAIKEDAHYMNLSRNDIEDNSVLQNQFKWVIQEASAFGFTSAVNSKIDFKFWGSLEEAKYKLTKHTSMEEWKRLSEES